MGGVAALMQQEPSWFEHHRHAEILPWLLQAYETCLKLPTEIKGRNAGIARQSFLAFDHRPVPYMRPLWGFSTVSLGLCISGGWCIDWLLAAPFKEHLFSFEVLPSHFQR
jgi:hypothetical protein